MSGIVTDAVCSFGGVPFYYNRGSNSATPIWPKEAVLSEEHVPGGSTDVVQNMGVKSTSTMTIPIALNSSAYTSLLSMVGSQATLVLVNNPNRSAIFKGFSGEKVFTAGFWRLNAEFLAL